jgi:transcriptional regulator with XRE-family HTH domain
MTLGDKIRLLRTEKKVSIRKLSDLTGLSKSTLSDIENNKSKKPTVDTIERVARALEIPISELFDEEEKITGSGAIGEKHDNDERVNSSHVFLRSVARAKERPKEIQDRIAAFIDLVLEQEDKK